MKTLNLLFLYLIGLFVFSCNSGENNNTEHNHSQHEQINKSGIDDFGLMLNNGEKWNSDAPTRVAFSNMQGILNSFQQTKKEPALADYNKLGNDLQAELNVLFKECRMEGEAHEQLHVLLEHIIADVKMLKSEVEADAANGYKNLPQHLQLFQQYFK